MVIKVVTSEEMKRIEESSYKKGFSEEAFMEQAGFGVATRAKEIIEERGLKREIILLCGHGNNAGDAFAAGRILLEWNFKVSALPLFPKERCSPLCQKNWNSFEKKGGSFLERTSDLQKASLLIDGILGTGFRGRLEGVFKEIVDKANASSVPILAIDIPSGIHGTTGECGGDPIHASLTLFLGLPKKGCFWGEAWNFVGNPQVYNFGLSQEALDEAKESFFLLEEKDILLPPIARNRHKYQAGYVVGVGGSLGMPGAIVLAGFASLKSGAGIVKIFHPAGMEGELSGAPPELIRIGYRDVRTIQEALEKAHALFVGPGMGIKEEALEMLKRLFSEVTIPCVIDAEALTLIAMHSLALPRTAILTPHHGEMKRLLQGRGFNLEEVKMYAQKKGVTIILKGSPTYIFHPDHTPFICCRGDPGMATAGAGDVLTGIIASLLAQGLDPLAAAQSGVMLHGIAGECAARALTSRAMVASDITHFLPEAIKEIMGLIPCKK